MIQQGAGLGAGFTDEEYVHEGASIVPTARDVFAKADLICKVKEPQPVEVAMLRSGQTLFCYLHLAPVPELTAGLLAAGVNAVALETIQTDDGYLPCLVPMSEIAGRMSVQVGAHYLQKESGGRGVLLGGAPGVEPATVLVLGGGCAGINATRMAVGLEARVTVLDIDLRRLAAVDELFSGRVRTVISNEHNIRELLPATDLLIGAVLIPGASAPRLITEDMLLHRPRRHPLLRRQHARCRAPHQHPGPDQRHPAVARAPGRGGG